MFDNSPQEETHLMFLIMTQHTLTRITHTHARTWTHGQVHTNLQETVCILSIWDAL